MKKAHRLLKKVCLLSLAASENTAELKRNFESFLQRYLLTYELLMVHNSQFVLQIPYYAYCM